jgi:hypothetical protein
MTYRVDVPQKESYKKVLVMAKILLKKKIAIKYTYDLFMVCYENGVGSNGKPFVRLIIAP